MNKPRVVAIHQPNFFPWLGFFDKIFRADVFVILDDVQMPHTGGTWCNRVRVRIDNDARWLTMPIVRAPGLRKISEVAINESTRWRDKVCGTLHACYGKAPFFKNLFPQCEPLVRCAEASLLLYNVQSIKGMLKLLGHPGNSLRLASEFDMASTGTQRLIDLVKACGGSTYLTGGGADGYQEDALFAEQGVSLLYQNFRHPVYDQGGREFLIGLSVLDALFWAGPEYIHEQLSAGSACRESSV